MLESKIHIIVGSLSAGDTSIQRLCLDLTYGLCDKKSSGSIVAELLAYLQRTMHDSSFADLSARDELVLKISILAERYSLSYRWYVGTFRLLSISKPKPRVFVRFLPTFLAVEKRSRAFFIVERS